MSVYQPKGSPFYHYDFVVKGHRFHGSTECRKRQDAERFEKERRLEAPALIAAEADKPRTGAMTFDLAAGRFWLEVGQFYRGNARKTFKRSLAWLVERTGPIRLAQITNSKIAELVAERRGQGSLLDGKNKRSGRALSNATVNRTVTEPLRRVMLRARDAWDEPIGKVDWKTHLLSEPKERVREMREHEEAALFGHMRDDYVPALAFLLVSGCRLAEAVNLRWTNIDWGARTISIRGKGDKADTIPLTATLRDILWPLHNHHSEVVFTYVAQRNRTVRKTERVIVAGERYPITYEGLKTAWRRHAAPVFRDFRLHDIRHTTATRLLRQTGNLKLVQRLLRHDDIATTTKYAHADDEDLRRAMEEVATAKKPGRQRSA